jgi:hypothetical protein
MRSEMGYRMLSSPDKTTMISCAYVSVDTDSSTVKIKTSTGNRYSMKND